MTIFIFLYGIEFILKLNNYSLKKLIIDLQN